jgi:pentatricopeptide repeat protein
LLSGVVDRSEAVDGQAGVDGGVDAVLGFLAHLRADGLEELEAPHSALGHVLATPACRLPGVLSPSERLFVEAVEGALADAVKTAAHRGEPDAFNACLERGLVVLDVLKRHGPPPNIRVYRQLVLAASRGGRPVLALHLLEETRQLGLALDLRCVHALVDTLPAEYAAPFAHELLTQLEAPLDVGAINSLLWRAAELSAGPPDVRAMLVHSLLSALGERGVMPDELTLAACVTALGRASRLDDALAVWTHLLAAGVTPGQRSWAALLSACRDAQQHEMCWSLFCTLRDEKRDVRLTRSGTRILYNIALDSAVRSQQYSRAFSLVDAMKSAGIAPDLVTRNTLLPAIAATAGLHAAVERALAPAFGADMVTWTRIMELAAQEGQPGVAAEALEAIQRAGSVPDVVAWTTLIRAHGSDAREAVMTWRQMRAAGVKPDAHTFQALLQCSLRANDPALASRVYAAMRSAGMGPNNRLFRELVSTSADAALSGAAAPSPSARDSKAVLPPTPRWMPDGLDLHGLSSTEARAAVLCALRDLRDSGSRAPRGGLAVITGRGSNNPQGLAVLRDEVLRLCGELRLPCSVDENNPGRVRISSAALQAWLKRTSQLPHS